MTKTEKVLSTIIKAVNCLMFLIEAVLIWFMGAHSVGFQTDFESLTIGWTLIIVSIALLLAAILIWTSKFSILFWITEIVLVAGFIALTSLRTMNTGTAFDILGPAAILAIMRYGRFAKPYVGPLSIVILNLAYIYLSTVPYDWYVNYWFTK
jgi:small multidrug resistance pump